MPTTPIIRRAVLADIEALVELEQRTFSTDHLSRRQYRHHVISEHACVLVAFEHEQLLGKAVVFFRRNSTVARLYSIAVAQAGRGRGLGEVLLSRVEQAAIARSCDRLRLEVRQDNAGAIRLYERLGYYRFGARAGYYEDGADAWRYEKRLTIMPSA